MSDIAYFFPIPPSSRQWAIEARRRPSGGARRRRRRLTPTPYMMHCDFLWHSLFLFFSSIDGYKACWNVVWCTEYNSMLSKQYGCIIIFLVNHRPICLNTKRCALSLPPPLYNCIAVDMLFNIVGHKIDCNYETWKKYGAKTTRRRLAPGRAPSFPHPGVRRFFWCSSHNAHIFFIFHIFSKKLLTLW